MSNRRVLITGVNGFIGCHLIQPLKQQGFEIHGICRQPFHDDDVFSHTADLFNLDETKKILDDVKPSYLIHTAWYTEPKLYWESSLNREWLEESKALASYFVELRGKKFVGIGTCAEYDWREHDFVPWSETRDCFPDTLYGQCKLALYHHLNHYLKGKNVSFVWARLFFPFGPGDHVSRLIPTICNGLILNKPIPLTKGDQIRDFISVEEIGRIIAFLTKESLEGVFNIGSGSAIKVSDVARYLARLEHKEELLKFGEIMNNDRQCPYIVADITKLNSIPNFKFSHDNEYYLRESLKWWRSKRRLG